jgi:hypothetical protein
MPLPGRKKKRRKQYEGEKIKKTTFSNYISFDPSRCDEHI